MKLNERIKLLRKSKKLSQNEIAKILHVASGTYFNYEKGDRKPPSDFLQRLINYFNVSPSWLLTGEGSMFKSDEADSESNKSATTISQPSGMPDDFINKLKDDLRGKDDSFFASLSISKDKILDVLIGRARLNRVEIIELARKLNRSLDEYMFLAGQVPAVFNRVLLNPKMMDSLRKAGELTDEEIDQAIDAFAEVFEKFEKDQKKKQKK